MATFTNQIKNADIISRLSIIANYVDVVVSATSSSIIAKCAIDSEDLTGWQLLFLSGNNRLEERLITAHDTNTGLISFANPLSFISLATDEIAINRVGFQRYALNALDIIREDFKNIGKDLDLFLTQEQLKELQLLKTLSQICLDKYQDGVNLDLYYRKYEDFTKSYDKIFHSIKADYDSNNNGAIEEEEKNQSFSKFGVLAR